MPSAFRSIVDRSFAPLALVAVAACGGSSASRRPATAHAGPAFAAAAANKPVQAFSNDTLDYVFPDPNRRRKLEATFGALDELVDKELATQKLPSIAFGVVIDGELAHVKTAGFADVEAKRAPDADTVYRIGSVTKSFTALAVLLARDDGRLALDDPLARWIPEAGQLVYPTRDAPPLTLRLLLTHTSGLPRLGNFDYTRADRAPFEAEIVASLRGFALENAPATKFVYSNLGFALLGIAVGRAEHASLRDVVSKRILQPLGMTSTVWDPEAVPAGRLAVGYKRSEGALAIAAGWRLGASEGAGGLHSTVRDMARYVAFQLAAYPPRSAPDEGPVRRSSVREAHASALVSRDLHVRMRDEPSPGESVVRASAGGYGFAWAVRQTCDLDDIVTHNGAVDGYAASVALLPEHGVGIVALANVTHADLDRLVFDALAALHKGGGLTRRVPHPTLVADFGDAMKSFLRVYNEWDDAAYAAMLANGRPKLASEKDELAGYKRFHGACNGFEPTEIVSPLHARFTLKCERGKLEMDVVISARDHRITGFGGTSRDVAAPPALDRAARDLAGLIKRWDEGIFKKRIAPSNKPRDEAKTGFERLRSAHGSCTVKTYVRRPDSDEFALACERGGNLKLVMKLDETNDAAIASYALGPEQVGVCPVR